MTSDTTKAAARGALVPRLPVAAWQVLLADALSALGSGLTLPFLLIYLSQVRQIDVATAGFAAAMVPLASFAGNPIGGWLSDRSGARTTLAVGLVISACGTAGFPLIRTAWQAFIPPLILGLGASIVWPSQDALLATTVDATHRSNAFSVRLATMNMGLGLGALLGTVLIDVHRPRSFTLIYLIDCATFLAAIALIVRLPTVPSPTSDDHGDTGGYRAVLADRTFRRVLVLSVLVITISYGQYHSGFPAFAARPGGISAERLGVAFAANTITVVAAQLFILRAVRGRTRTSVLSLACACWALAWLVTVAAGELGSGAGAITGFTVAMVIFAFAETMLAPTLPAIVNDLAPDHLRGRYNGTSALAWTTGFFTGPILAGLALDNDHGTALFATLTGAALIAAASAARTARHLPTTVNTAV